MNITAKLHKAELKPPVVVVSPNTYQAGGKHVGGKYMPPNPNQIDWVTTGGLVVDNTSTGDYLIQGQNLQFFGDTGTLDRMINFAASNNRLLFIDGCNLRAKDHIVYGSQGAARIRFRNTNIFRLPTAVTDEANMRVCDKDGLTWASFENCYLEGGGGFRVGGVANGYYRCTANRAVSLDGRRTNATKKPVQLQLFQVAGGSNLDMLSEWNDSYNHPDNSRVEDNQNFYHGTYASGLVRFNRVDGAYMNPRALYDLNGDGYAGGGLINEGSDNLRIEDNFVVRCSNYGVAIAGGTNSALRRNRVVNGIHYREGVNQGKIIIDVGKALYSLGGSGNVVQDNKLASMYFPPANKTKPEAQWAYQQRNDWDVDQTKNTATGNTFLSAPNTYSTSNGGYFITKADEDACLDAWEALRASNNVLVGPKA
ncbi:hypothetical protein [Hymenobacter sp. BT491]|uniref:hypothetical protein n=1 Tax=Hymenobacter sp. BT491 TaxID=2766779 RepID=UPI00165350B9|nr:hypothetical protein [Hymenobacter sp. BT491]MBC6988920.1 hypothetical protein [Hymenobacter sp. BT491]